MCYVIKFSSTLNQGLLTTYTMTAGHSKKSNQLKIMKVSTLNLIGKFYVNSLHGMLRRFRGTFLFFLIDVLYKIMMFQVSAILWIVSSQQFLVV